ncbi:MAG: RHS repeat-associated core domain-containing protein, partial [Flavobacteriaceae bacterium]
SDWTTTITGYDQKGRAIYTASRNDYLGTTDIMETELDFGGKVVQTRTTHTKDGNSAIVTVDDFTYDHEGRLLRQKQTIGSQSQETLADNTYDNLGQLEQKKVGGGLQTIDYTYNVRRWLKSVNNGVATGGDLWGMEISYHDPTNFGGNENPTALFNGNISQVRWKTASTNTSGNPVSERYSLGYDALNRLTSAHDNTGNYDVMGIAYDRNGNLQSLTRDGWQNGSFANMDVLDYEYHNSGTSNQLYKVRDDGNDGHGFKDSSADDQDYWYDADGNLTRDDNKGITAIEYNHFDRPTKVTVTGSNAGTLDFVYAADGTKLQKIKTQGGSTSTTDYAGNHIYENGTLVQFTHPEGHVVPEGSGWRYVYDYTDHLGTVRLSYSDLDGNGTIDAASEILQERNTYPFGLVQKGYNGNINGPENNYQTYLGQEINKELGLDWLSFRHRNYIPEIGRFFGVDPIAEEYPNQTPYQFASNNPIWKIELEGLEGFPTTEEDFINGLGYGVDPGDGTAVQVGEGGILSEGYLSSALGAVGDFFGSIHDGLSGAIESGVRAVMGTAEPSTVMSESEFNDAIVSGDENAVYSGLEADAAALYNAVPEVAGEVGAMAVEAAAAEFIGPRLPSSKSSSSANTGKIYKVDGGATTSGKPYIGRTQQSSPAARGRNARDGRDRTNAAVIDTYDPTKPGQGAYKEQKAIDAEGGVKNLDNKRNERTPAKMEELEKKYGNGNGS